MYYYFADINECNDNICEHNCSNTIPFYSCYCNNGYRSYGFNFCEGKTYFNFFVIIINQKIDIDECIEGTSGCNQVCSNTLGSYECSCERGYELDTDNHTCTDIDECIINNGGCEQSCINTNGSYYCTCDYGYVLNDDRHFCSGKLEFIYQNYT